MTQTATSPQRKPLLDEASFQQLLSAAYVLQEHNDRLRAKGFQADFAENLSAIVETQKLIQTLQLDLPAAAELVAERVQKITNASGTAIGILEKGELFYRACTGSAAPDSGTHVAPESALSADCLSRGSALNYPDVTPSLHVHAERFRERDVKAFIAVPVYHAGQVSGVLELRFARINSFREADLRTAELMAGLLSEAMVTAARMKWKEALASERQSMLEALERIKPQIERLGSESLLIENVLAAAPPAFPVERSPAERSDERSAERSTVKPEPPVTRIAETCSACGSDFFDDSESFCGICGTARPAPGPALDELSAVPIKTDSPWLTPYGQENPSNGNSGGIPLRSENAAAKAVAASLHTMATPEPSSTQPNPFSPSVVEAPVVPGAPPVAAPVPDIDAPSTVVNLPVPFPPPAEAPGPDSLRIVPADPHPLDQQGLDQLTLNQQLPGQQIQPYPYPWGSAKKAQSWLETVKGGRRAEWLAHQWQRRRANIYLVAAVIIFLVVISGWGIRPSGTAAAGNTASTPNGQHQGPPPLQLTLFEKMLVGLGLAEPPPAPVYMGNPETQVWVDVHTALYYCPGSDLYGKTADGKFAVQRDAQQDQFEPANRKACP